ncbi:large ribosomal subunit protein uL29c [Rutidosis leptorrhynchoides]|uniref:large ribosomal subunit protein uL29c n=1 Tax=Rutidosis leptorrhynchoides TaxID=125765 RepID=UPI003A996B1F
MLTLSSIASSTSAISTTPKTSFTYSSSFIITSHKSSFNGIRIAHVLPQQTTLRTTNKSQSSVIMMAKKEEELKEIRAKTTDEINDEIVDLKGELFMLRLQRSARNEFKSSEFRRMRKRVARMLTVKREREIADGITSKRLSRKLDREWRKSIVPRPPPSLKKLQEEAAAEEAKESASA